MGGTCLGPLTMVTRDLSECGGARGGRAGLRGQVGLYPDLCSPSAGRRRRRHLEDAARWDHVLFAWADGVISAGNCDGVSYSHNHLERFCSWSNMPVLAFFATPAV